MIEQVYWRNSSYWPILNLHAIFVRNSPALDIFCSRYLAHIGVFCFHLLLECYRFHKITRELNHKCKRIGWWQNQHLKKYILEAGDKMSAHAGQT